ncbi:MAG: HEPN domain-containing protein [Armatimonadetes bacterium]|nr:HEPN domain-containing protein [Armatimonadota bacterium]
MAGWRGAAGAEHPPRRARRGTSADRHTVALLSRAESSIEAAGILAAQEGMAGFTVSRAYYAMFYVAETLLAEQGLDLSKHSAVISKFGQVFARQSLMDAKFYRMLIDAQERRLIGDYRATEELTSTKL